MKNRLKERLSQNRTTFGSWITISHPVIAEFLSTVGFDWFVFDQEHSPLDVDTTQIMIQAIAADTVTPLVRVAWNDQVRIKKALDIGAHGLIIPMVNTAADAEQAVRACTYPPEGIRGCGPSRALVMDPEYLETADDETLVIIQIESEEAVEHAESIFSVDGVDAFFLGPVDLSYSFGLRGDLADSRLQRAIDHVFEVAARNGLPGGIWQGAGRTIPERISEGWRMIGVGFDAQYLLEGARAALGRTGVGD
ncbi:MAG: HpcH/HpaI aldolase family protein [Spirochaetota bacterium]